MFNSRPRVLPRLTSLLLLSAVGFSPSLANASAAHDTAVPQSHAPIAVMGDHIHKQGEFMFSYRFMRMDMAGNRDGRSSISPQTIATSVSNRFAKPPMQPQTLRVVPTEMTMDMHMLGMMYASSDELTLMLMTSYQQKKMRHLTFMGPMGSTVLGEFETETKGLGDTSLTALVRLNRGVHLNAGLSLPSGEIKETGQILTPMNTAPSPRLPYPMQLGSGSVDPIIGLSYSDVLDRWGWGAQWRSVYRFWHNSEDYKLGNEHKFSGWGAYQFGRSVSLSARLEYIQRGRIKGMDAAIQAPVQTADPTRYGLQRVDAAIGLNFLVPGSKHRLGFELLAPIYQDLNGPQLETDWTVTLGWQYSP